MDKTVALSVINSAIKEIEKSLPILNESNMTTESDGLKMNLERIIK